MSINNHDTYDNSIDKIHHRLYVRFLLGITMTTEGNKTKTGSR